MSQPFIAVKNLSFTYDDDETANKHYVLKNFSLEIEQGSFVCVLGHNGSGKSTFAKLLNMILTPDAGTILIDGTDITRPDMTEDEVFEVRSNIGMVFQNPDNQLVATIVEEDVAFGPENLGIPPMEIRRRVDDALATVGMTEYARHAPHQLSGGQKQRVALAGILAMEPDCIVLDEPTAMLDPIGRHEVINTITKLNKEKNITIILITHFMEEAANADRVLVMNKGNIVADGTPSEVFEMDNVLKASGLSLPQTTELLLELKKSGLELNTGIISPKAAAEEIFSSVFGG